MKLEYGTALFTERQESGFIGIQPDRHGAGAGGPALEVAMPFGLIGRPLDPDRDPSGAVKVGANVLVFSDGDEGFALPTGDPAAWMRWQRAPRKQGRDTARRS